MLIYLIGVIQAFTYTGSFALDDLSLAPSTALCLIVAGLLTKSGIFLCGIWVPNIYTNASIQSSSILSGCVTCAGIAPISRMSQILTHFKLFLVAMIWGLGWPAGRVVANDILPFAASWIRYVIAVLLFLILLYFSKQWVIPTRTEWKRLALIGFFSTCVYQAFFMYGMQYTAAGDASLMITFNPLFTAIFNFLIIKLIILI